MKIICNYNVLRISTRDVQIGTIFIIDEIAFRRLITEYAITRRSYLLWQFFFPNT